MKNTDTNQEEQDAKKRAVLVKIQRIKTVSNMLIRELITQPTEEASSYQQVIKRIQTGYSPDINKEAEWYYTMAKKSANKLVEAKGIQVIGRRDTSIGECFREMMIFGFLEGLTELLEDAELELSKLSDESDDDKEGREALSVLKRRLSHNTGDDPKSLVNGGENLARE